MSADSFEVEVDYPRSKARVVLLAFLWAVVAPLAFVAVGKAVGGAGGGPPSWLVPALLGIVGAGAGASAVAYRRNHRRRGRLEISEVSVAVSHGGARREIPREAIENALFLPGDGSAAASGRERVALDLTSGERLDVAFDSAEAARAALAALARREDRSATHLRLYTPGQRTVAQFGGGALGMLLGTIPAGVVVLALGGLGSALAVLMMIPFALSGARLMTALMPELWIGSDGIAFKGTTTSATDFVPFERFEGVRIVRQDMHKMPRAHVIELVERGEAPRRLAVLAADQAELAHALVRRIDDTVRERRRRATGVTLAELERHGQSAAEWLATLRRVASSQSDYRNAAVTTEQLLELLESASASPEHRLGAAVVLAHGGDATGRDRVRVAAEAVAGPRMRVALENVARGDEDADVLAEALEEARRDEA